MCLEENTLFEYLCGGLALGARDAVAAHAAACAGCRRMIAAAAGAPGQPGQREGDPRGAGGERPDRLLAGRYRLVRLLGAGGMGTVHEAIDTRTGRWVAIKQLRVMVAGDGLAAERFLREARSARLIAHPGVVDILDLGRDGETGALFMVQELLVGATLRRRIAERGALSVDEAVAVMVPALAALRHAHAAGVVHRDLKPDNLFLARDGAGRETTKLIDFGLCKQLRGDAGRAITRRGGQLGTPFYMSPEQLRGDADLDDRSDVWSVGVVLFEAVAGARPFAAAGYDQLILQILGGPVPRLADRVPAVPAAFSALVERTLERDRGLRPRSGELHDALVGLATPGSRRRSAGTGSPGGCTSTATPCGSR